MTLASAKIAAAAHPRTESSFAMEEAAYLRSRQSHRQTPSKEHLTLTRNRVDKKGLVENYVVTKPFPQSVASRGFERVANLLETSHEYRCQAKLVSKFLYLLFPK